MIWLLVICYLCSHLALYVLIFRHQPRFRTEVGVLVLHVVSAVLLVAVMLVRLVLGPTEEKFALVLAAGAAHGIYSLSFLEIWALSEGGYSLRVLHEVATRGKSTLADLEAAFTATSNRKKEGRLDSLLRLRLIQREENGYSLSTYGRIAVRFISTMSFLAQIKKMV